MKRSISSKFRDTILVILLSNVSFIQQLYLLFKDSELDPLQLQQTHASWQMLSQYIERE